MAAKLSEFYGQNNAYNNQQLVQEFGSIISYAGSPPSTTQRVTIAGSVPISGLLDIKPKKKEGYMKELIKDAKDFIKEHKGLFYWIALIALADHFIFEGTFRDKLKSIVQKMIGKLETKVDNAS